MVSYLILSRVTLPYKRFITLTLYFLALYAYFFRWHRYERRTITMKNHEVNQPDSLKHLKSKMARYNLTFVLIRRHTVTTYLESKP